MKDGGEGRCRHVSGHLQVCGRRVWNVGEGRTVRMRGEGESPGRRGCGICGMGREVLIGIKKRGRPDSLQTQGRGLGWTKARRKEITEKMEIPRKKLDLPILKKKKTRLQAPF